MAGGLGFEPRQAESESAVLPLDDPPTGAGQDPALGGLSYQASPLGATLSPAARTQPLALEREDDPAVQAVDPTSRKSCGAIGRQYSR